LLSRVFAGAYGSVPGGLTEKIDLEPAEGEKGKIVESKEVVAAFK
jgi:hypothetical protein